MDGLTGQAQPVYPDPAQCYDRSRPDGYTLPDHVTRNDYRAAAVVMANQLPTVGEMIKAGSLNKTLFKTIFGAVPLLILLLLFIKHTNNA
jgi:hypothetical protein